MHLYWNKIVKIVSLIKCDFIIVIKVEQDFQRPLACYAILYKVYSDNF
jgi:hypothetical protein